MFIYTLTAALYLQDADDHHVGAAATDLIDKSLTTVLGLWQNKRQQFKSAETVPKLSLTIQPVDPIALPQDTPTSPETTPTASQVLPSLATPTASPSKDDALALSPTPTSPVKDKTSSQLFQTSPNKEPYSGEDKENQLSSQGKC